jgi:hypothetical protein
LSERDDELELEALQRRLDDAFETTRPRRGFEDELWTQIQRRRPFGSRLADFFGGLGSWIRQAPAVPLGALALLVIVAIGVGVIGPNLLGSHGTSLSTGAGMAPEAGGAARAEYGLLPTPMLHPGATENFPVPGQTDHTSAATPGNYYGPANLVWSGSFPNGSVAAPVFIYAEPPTAESRIVAANISAMQGVALQTQGSVPQLPREPVFYLIEQGSSAPSGSDPVTIASSFLVEHNALPTWPNNIAVTGLGDATFVVYQRAFALPGGDQAFLVDWNGDRYGIAVTIRGGKRMAIGPLPLALQSVSLPLISNSMAAQMAVSQPPASTSGFIPIPTVNLDHVELVYALAISGSNGFYQPAYLFSGTFSYNGQTYTKRVLVPLVVPSLRS